MISQIISNRLIVILSVFIFVLNLNSVAQKLTVETTIDTNRITLGDQIGLNYIIHKKNDIRIQLPDISDTLIDGIEIIGTPVIDSTKIDNENWEVSLVLTITSFDTGLYYIPPQAIAFNDDLFSDTLFSKATYLEVIGVSIDTTNTVRDIKGPDSVPVTVGEVLMYAIPILLIVALAYFAFIYFRRRKSEQPIFKPAKPEEPAYITALRELDKIKAQKLWQQNKVKEFYTSITHVIRWYIEKRFNIPALEQVSDEILELVRIQKLDDINYSNLESLLNLADLVKFAKGNPDPEENMIHLDNAYDFLKKTRENISDSPEEKQIEE